MAKKSKKVGVKFTKKQAQAATNEVLQWLPGEAHMIELLWSIIPNSYRFPPGRDPAWPWVTAIRYIDHLTGRSTNLDTNFRPGEKLYTEAMRAALSRTVPVRYLLCLARATNPEVLPAAAIAYIVTELMPSSKALLKSAKKRLRKAMKTEEKKNSSKDQQTRMREHATALMISNSNNVNMEGASEHTPMITSEDEDSSNGIEDAGQVSPANHVSTKDIEEAGQVIPAFDHLLAQISKYKRIEVDKNDSARIMSVAEEMVQELAKGENDITKFGARGDGDFEKMALAVYQLRLYFDDEVMDDSEINNLLQLARLALELHKTMTDALKIIKECFKNLQVPIPLIEAPQQEDASSAMQGVESTQNTVMLSGPRPLNSFGFCNRENIQHASLLSFGQTLPLARADEGVQAESGDDDDDDDDDAAAADGDGGGGDDDDDDDAGTALGIQAEALVDDDDDDDDPYNDPEKAAELKARCMKSWCGPLRGSY